MDVTAIGETLIDFTDQGKDPQGYPLLQAHPGGAPANFLAAMAAYGAAGALITKVGEDMFGRLLKETLEQLDLYCDGVLTDKHVFTTMAFVTLDKNGDRKFSFARKPGADTCLRKEEIPFYIIARSKALYFGITSLTAEPCRSAVYEAVAYARKNRKLIIFDPNLRKNLWKDASRPREEMLWGIRQADILKISEEELEFLFEEEEEKALKTLQERENLQLIFLTRGAKGCTVLTKRFQEDCKGLKGITVQDTTGAGDIFLGSAVYRLLTLGKEIGQLEREDLRTIIRFACTAAGLSTTKQGAISSIPGLDTVLGYLEKEF